MALDAEIDKLYELPLDEFVGGRDELAKRVRREGDREEADRVKALRKPTVGAWALNQAVRRRRRETKALLAAGERLRAAHESLMSGGDRDELREAMSEERELVGVLADCAEAIASESGMAGPALKERVRATLHAAAVDDEAREELTSGRLVHEREAVGLGPFGAMPTAPRKPGARKTAREGRAGRARSGRAAAAPSDGATKGRSGRAAAAARGGAKERDARAAAEREEAAARERAEQIEAAEQRVGEAEAELAEAEQEKEATAAELDSARQALRAAEAAEREARKVARQREREVAKRKRELGRLRRTTS